MNGIKFTQRKNNKIRVSLKFKDGSKNQYTTTFLRDARDHFLTDYMLELHGLTSFVEYFLRDKPPSKPDHGTLTKAAKKFGMGSDRVRQIFMRTVRAEKVKIFAYGDEALKSKIRELLDKNGGYRGY